LFLSSRVLDTFVSIFCELPGSIILSACLVGVCSFFGHYPGDT